jgi:hypothetical protein
MMTEAVWLGGCEPGPMLDHILDRAAARQLRLFACGCVRVLGHLLPDQKARKAFFVAERYADRHASSLELVQAHAEAQAAHRYLIGPRAPLDPYGAQVSTMPWCGQQPRWKPGRWRAPPRWRC